MRPKLLLWFLNQRKAAGHQHWLYQQMKLVSLALLSAIPFCLAFFPDSHIAPYVSLIAFVPSLLVVSRLGTAREVVVFCVMTSLCAQALVTDWLPHTFANIFDVNLLGASVLSGLAWAFWCGGVSLFLILYRYFHEAHLLFVACIGVVLFQYWPSVFGGNPFTALMHAPAISGSALFIGTAGIELVAILFSAWLARALIKRRVGPGIQALSALMLLLALDGFAAWIVADAPKTTLNVTLVQTTNVYSKKLSSGAEIEMFAEQLVKESRFAPDLIVFPENVFSFNLADDPQAGAAAMDALKRVSSEHPVAFLISTVQSVPGNGSAIKNHKRPSLVSAMLISDGAVQGHADKARTIPFAEYTPAWATAPLIWLGAKIETRTPSSRYSAMSVKGVPLVPLNCFESLDQAVVESRLGGGPGLLINQSNLGDFGTPASSNYRAALWGHMAHEQRWVNQWHAPMVRAVRGGGSTSIDASGAVDQALLEQSWGKEWVSTPIAVPGASPIYAYTGHMRLAFSLFILALAVFASARCVALCLRSKRRPLVGEI